VYATVSAVKVVPWLRADNSRTPKADFPPNPIYPYKVAERIKALVKEKGLPFEGKEVVDGEVWDW